MGAGTNIKEISEDTIEIAEDDYYVILATLHASKDHTLSNEADEEGTAPLLEEDDEREGENESDERPSSRPKKGEIRDKQEKSITCFIDESMGETPPSRPSKNYAVVKR